MTWRDRAACRDVPTEIANLFFPGDARGADDDHRYDPLARALCAGCPVRADCLDHAISHGEEYGMWGGMTPSERRRIRRTAAA